LPFVCAVCLQPVTGSQASVAYTSRFRSSRAVPAWHVPAALQTSRPSQIVALSHVRPGTGVFTQPVAGLQLSSVHTLPSLQLSGVPAWHAPAWHVSAPLHALPSEHAVPFV